MVLWLALPGVTVLARGAGLPALALATHVGLAAIGFLLVAGSLVARRAMALCGASPGPFVGPPRRAMRALSPSAAIGRSTTRGAGCLPSRADPKERGAHETSVREWCGPRGGTRGGTADATRSARVAADATAGVAARDGAPGARRVRPGRRAGTAAQRVALVLDDDDAALGDALARFDGDTSLVDREQFGREEEEAAWFLAMLTGAEAARAARSEEPHLRVVPLLEDADE